MTPEEFTQLPPAIALRILLDILPASMTTKLEAVEKPQMPRTPKYDLRVWRKAGFQWASEMSLEGLTFVRNRSLESADKGGDYAEKDAKQAEKLKYWTDYRAVFPDNAVGVIRGEDSVTAEPPRDKARIWTPLPKGDDDVPF